MRHPRELGASEVKAFLSMLATERKVSSSTHNQALRAVLFLYREVLGSGEQCYVFDSYKIIFHES